MYMCDISCVSVAGGATAIEAFNRRETIQTTVHERRRKVSCSRYSSLLFISSLFTPFLLTSLLSSHLSWPLMLYVCRILADEKAAAHSTKWSKSQVKRDETDEMRDQPSLVGLFIYSLVALTLLFSSLLF